MTQKEAADETKRLLNDYPEFAGQARLLAIEQFVNQYEQTAGPKEKALLHLLAFEQFAMLVEAFEAFFRAILHRKRQPILQTVRRDFNPGNLTDYLEARTPEQVLEEMQLVLEQFSPQEQGEIRKRFLNMVEGVRRISAHNKTFLVPMYNALKHKFLVYRDPQGQIVFHLHPEQRRIIGERYPYWLVGQATPADIRYLLDMGTRLTTAIQDLIAIYLLEADS